MKSILRMIPVVAVLLASCSVDRIKREIGTRGGSPTDEAAEQIAQIDEGDADLASLQANRYRGYDAINHVVAQRLFKDESFALAHYIEDTSELGIFAAFVSTLKDLLGGFKGTGLQSGFRNGSPNTMNVTLWHMAFSGLAKDVAEACSESDRPIGPYKASDEFLAALEPLCAWPMASETRRASLETFWTALVDMDAPLSERDAWLEFALSDDMQGASTDEALFNLTFAAFYSPHFLIAK